MHSSLDGINKEKPNYRGRFHLPPGATGVLKLFSVWGMVCTDWVLQITKGHNFDIKFFDLADTRVTETDGP